MTEKAHRFGDIISRINAGILRDQQGSIDNNPVEQQDRTFAHVTPDENCTHHWKIETPAGETSMGICAHCAGTKDFRNEFDVIPDWHEYRSKSKIPNAEAE